MIEFETGERINVLNNNKIRVGKILKIYALNQPVVLVDYENGETGKVSLNRIAKLDSPEKENNKGEITISKEEFTDKGSEALAELVSPCNSTTYQILAGIFLAEICKAIFPDDPEDDPEDDPRRSLR